MEIRHPASDRRMIAFTSQVGLAEMRLYYDRGAFLNLLLSFMCGKASSRTIKLGLFGPFPIFHSTLLGWTTFPIRLYLLIHLLPLGISCGPWQSKGSAECAEAPSDRLGPTLLPRGAKSLSAAAPAAWALVHGRPLLVRGVGLYQSWLSWETR